MPASLLPRLLVQLEVLLVVDLRQLPQRVTAPSAPLLNGHAVVGGEGAPGDGGQPWHLLHLLELVVVAQRLHLRCHNRRRDRVARLRLAWEVLVAMLLLVLLEVELGREVAIVEGADGLVGLVPEVVVHQDRLWEQVGLDWADRLQVGMARWEERLSAAVHWR